MLRDAHQLGHSFGPGIALVTEDADFQFGGERRLSGINLDICVAGNQPSGQRIRIPDRACRPNQRGQVVGYPVLEDLRLFQGLQVILTTPSHIVDGGQRHQVIRFKGL